MKEISRPSARNLRPGQIAPHTSAHIPHDQFRANLALSHAGWDNTPETRLYWVLYVFFIISYYKGTRAARGRAARREGARCVTRARGARCGVARREGARRVPRRGDRARGRAARARREGARAARGRAVYLL